MSVWYLSRMCSVSLACLRVDVVDAEQHQRARPVDGLATRTAPSSGRAGGCERTMRAIWSARLSVTPGTLVEHDLLLALQCRGSRRGGTGSAASAPRTSSRVLFDVRNTSGICLAVMVPSSGIDTWYSDRISSSSASVSTSTRSTSSISSTTGSSARDRLEQRAGEQELVGEDVVVDLAPRVAVAVGLDAQQLLLVVPLVERLATRRAPRSTAGGSAAHRSSRRRVLASCVLPVPAGPSTSTGLPSRSARNTTPAMPSSAR